MAPCSDFGVVLIAMPFAVPISAAQPADAPSAIVRTVTRADILWNRPIFKAPPLVVVPPVADLSELERAVRKPDAILA